MNLRVGVVVGRFQVPQLHFGHVSLLQYVHARCDRLVVLLGVSKLDGRVPENPLSFNQRQSLFTSVEVAAVLPLFDEPTNEAWSAQIDAVLERTYPECDITLYGGRESFVASYSGRLPVESVTIEPSVADAGTSHRAAIKESVDAQFLQGYIHALQRQWPHAHQAVDIALVNRPKVLLIQRADTGAWAFPGGFVDPRHDKSLEAAATRELYEEVGLSVAGGVSELAYVTSLRVDDWRYRGSRDKIMSALFVGWYGHGTPKLDPTEVQDFRWVTFAEGADVICTTHAPLWRALCDKVRS